MQSTSYCKVHFVGERSVSVVRVPSPSKRTPRRVPRRARRRLRDACSGTCGSGGCPLRQSLTCASLPGRRVSFSHRRRLHVPGPRGSRRCRGAAPCRRRTSAPEAIPGRDRPGPSSHSRPQPCAEPMRTFARGGTSPFRGVGGSEDGGMLGGAGSRAHQGMELPHMPVRRRDARSIHASTPVTGGGSGVGPRSAVGCRYNAWTPPWGFAQGARPAGGTASRRFGHFDSEPQET